MFSLSESRSSILPAAETDRLYNDLHGDIDLRIARLCIKPLAWHLSNFLIYELGTRIYMLNPDRSHCGLLMTWTRDWPGQHELLDVRPMLAQRRRRWANIGLTLVQCRVFFAGNVLIYAPLWDPGRCPRVVVSNAAFHARVWGPLPGLGGLKETKLLLPHPLVKLTEAASVTER